MTVARSETLHSPELERALNTSLSRQGYVPEQIVKTVPNEYASCYESFVIWCKLAGGKQLKVVCKRGASTPSFMHSYRRGVGHEALVYAKILSRISTPTAKYFGSYMDASSQTWLFIEYLEDSQRLDEYLEDAQSVDYCPSVEGVCKAVEWLGRFHGENMSLIERVSFLPNLDLSYFGYWAERAFEFTKPLHKTHPWLPIVLKAPDEVFGPLVGGFPVIIHGEFYPSNVLFNGTAIYPIDWECCAIGPAELDIAFLTEGWPSVVEELCRKKYEEARGDGEPVAWRRLAAARAYLAVRYLGHKPGLAGKQRGPERLEILHTFAKELGAVRV